MTADLPESALELRSLVTSQGTLELSLHDVPVSQRPPPMRCWYGWRPRRSTRQTWGCSSPAPTCRLRRWRARRSVPSSPHRWETGTLGALSARVDKSLPVGNEGAGTVVAAGSSPAAQALLGKTVGIAGGAMYSQYRVVDAAACLVLPEGATAKDGASSFVNPLTALGMLETMRREGHSALVHTAAASNLGQMLVKLCQTGRRAAGQYRPQARARGAADGDGRGPRLQFELAIV